MVPTGTIAGLFVALVLSIGAPIAVLLVVRGRMIISWRNILIGALVFLLFALILEQVMHYFVLQANPTTSMWIRNNPWGYVAYGVMAAALFEEIGRYLAMRTVVKPTGEPGTGVAYGIGHGGIEAWVIAALPQFQFLMMSLMMNQGTLDSTMAGSMPVETLAAIKNMLQNMVFFDFAYGGIERVVAVLGHVAFSILVWKAVSQRKVIWLLAAIAGHAVFDIPAAMYQAGMLSMDWVRITMIGAGVLLLAIYLMRLPPRMMPAAPAVEAKPA